MLNQATAAQERSVVPLLLTLNGGAAVAYLTLLGGLGKDSASLRFDLVWAQLAVVAWMVGLLLAAMAGWGAARQQALINRAHRLMREQVEDELFHRQVAEIVAPEGLTALQRQAERDLANSQKATWGNRYQRAWMASAGAFVVGALLALVALS